MIKHDFVFGTFFNYLKENEIELTHLQLRFFTIILNAIVEYDDLFRLFTCCGSGLTFVLSHIDRFSKDLKYFDKEFDKKFKNKMLEITEKEFLYGDSDPNNPPKGILSLEEDKEEKE